MSEPRSLRRYYRLPKEEIAFIRFIVEAYDGLAQVTSLPGRAEMEWVIPEELIEQAEALAVSLAKEIPLVPIPRPEDWPSTEEN
jgi:hypothetical protein